MPAWVTAAVLVLWAPGGFRVTCYYYRGAYYKAFWADPPSCTVGEPRKKISRGTLLSADPAKRPSLFSVSRVGVLIFSGARCVEGVWFDGRFGIGIVTLVLLTNVIFLSCYAFGCHSLRHLAGGFRNRLCGRARPEAGVRLRELPQSAAHGFCVVQLVLRRVFRCVRADVLDGRVDDWRNLLVTGIPDARARRFDYWSGRRGPAAAVGRFGGRRKVAVISKSLLGKAHTVMAERRPSQPRLRMSTTEITGAFTSRTRCVEANT